MADSHGTFGSSVVIAGDIVQVIDVEHAWFSCIMIVEEVKGWVIVGYIPIPMANDRHDVSLAYNRFSTGQYIKVGTAFYAKLGG